MQIFAFIRYQIRLALNARPLSPYSHCFSHRLPTMTAMNNFTLSEKLRESLFLEGDIFYYTHARMGLTHILLTMHKSYPHAKHVIVPAFTCAVVINAIYRAGLSPVYCDISPQTLGSCPISIIRLLEKYSCSALAIIAQHSFGIPCQIDIISDICKNRNIFLIEDCATTLGSYYKSVYCGNWGDASIFSFDTSKPINCGCGGILNINNQTLASHHAIEYQKLKTQSFSDYLYFRLIRFIHSKVYSRSIPPIGMLCHNLLSLFISRIMNFNGYVDWMNIPPLTSPSSLSSLTVPNKNFYTDLYMELCSWPENLRIRRYIYNFFLNDPGIHHSYRWCDNSYVVPLRIVFNCFSSNSTCISSHFDQNHHWFTPLLQGAISKDLSIYSSLAQSCPVSTYISMYTKSVVVSPQLKNFLENHSF